MNGVPKLIQICIHIKNFILFTWRVFAHVAADRSRYAVIVCSFYLPFEFKFRILRIVLFSPVANWYTHRKGWLNIQNKHRFKLYIQNHKGLFFLLIYPNYMHIQAEWILSMNSITCSLERRKKIDEKGIKNSAHNL